MSDDGPQHVTISTMPTVPPITGVVNVGPPPRKRHTVAIVVVVALTVAAIGAGVFAVVSLRSDPDGAATPTEAVEQFFDAIADQDVLGMLEVVLPGERATLGQPLIDLVEEMKRLGLLAETTDLSSISGVDIRIEGLRTTSRDITDDITNVDVRGVVLIGADARDLPLGELLNDLVADVEPADAAIEGEPERLDGLRITTVKQGGRWYVSLFFSIAESLRLDAGLDPVPAAAAVRPFGSDSPEAAIDQVLRSMQDLDLERLIAVLNPNEAAALQRYAPLFIDDAQADLDALPLRWTIDETAYDVEVRGDLAVVVPRSLRVDGEFEGESFSFEFADDCVRVQIEGESQQFCTNETGSLSDLFNDQGLGDGGFGEVDEEVRALVDEFGAAFEDIGSLGIVTKKVSGRWYVSPIGTVTEWLLAVARALDRDELESLIDGVGDLFSDTGDFELPSIEFEVFSCSTSSDVDVVLDCIDLGVSDGRFTLADVPAELRFPQCGLAESFVNGFWDLSDAEFMSVVEEAHVCFLLLFFGGEIDVLEIPYEARDPECFDGGNPYGTDDFRETDRRFAEINACLAQS